MIALAGTPVVMTERLVLRAPESGDWPAFHAFLASERGQFVRTGDYDLSNTWRGFCHLIGHWAVRGFGMFVFHTKGDATPLGATGPWFPETWPEREISWAVWNAAAEGKGFAFEAAAAARDFAYRTLGWTTAVSYVAEGNARSRALALRLGAQVDSGAQSIGTPPCLVFRHPAPDSMRTA
jgi:RimJ/RimL family protein N-acetyltransferase